MVDELPEAVRCAYETEIERLERALEHATENEAAKIRESIADLQVELLSEFFDLD